MTMEIISVISAVVATISVIITYIIYKKTRVDESYLNIDKQYLELLRIALSDINLRNYDKTLIYYKNHDDPSYETRYSIYAYMCWNLVETIYDKQKDSKGRFKLSETWLPVMLEENRLHYTWYKHNLRLFKPEFQRFVTETLNDIIIDNGTVDDLKEIVSKFNKDFPLSERKSIEHIEMLMLKGNYKLLLAKHKIFDSIIGYAFVYDLPNINVSWLDYMAIDNKYQNAGYGTLLFNKIIELRQDNIGMFLEIEQPEENDRKDNDKRKRIRFYERLGARKINIEYLFPTKNGGYPLYLYFKPTSSLKILPKETTKECLLDVFNYIHSDIPNHDDIFKSFLNTINDTHFD